LDQCKAKTDSRPVLGSVGSVKNVGEEEADELE